MSDEPKTIYASFDALYSKYKHKFVSIALSYVRDKNIAEDIVTDSFIAYWERRETLELEGSPQAFILGIVKNKCLMVLRDQKTFERVCQDVYRFSQWEIKHNTAVLEDCDLTKQLFSSEVADIYRAQLKSMPDITRKVYLASRDENMTYKQISEKYGLTVRQVNREMQRALGLLRVGLKDYLPLALIYIIIKGTC